MRFLLGFGLSALVLMPVTASAQQETGTQTAIPPPANVPAGTEQPATQAPEPKGWTHGTACESEISPELEAMLGEVVARPDDGQTMHIPKGLKVLDHQVSYVLVTREDDRIDTIAYRLQGMERAVGQPHDAQLLRAFDREYKAAKCARSEESICGVIYEGQRFSGAEIGSGELYVASGATGPSLSLVEADYDLMDSDPVFLSCFYRGK